MNLYNRYHHCNETFYTGRGIKKIQCSECGENIQFDDIIETRNDLSENDMDILEVFESEEDIQ